MMIDLESKKYLTKENIKSLAPSVFSSKPSNPKTPKPLTHEI